jgi:hypothetical protein
MKSQYKRDISEDYFRPLKTFHYNPSFHAVTATNKQLVLTTNLHRSYGIREGNMLRLIIYADISLRWATESEIELYYSDLHEIAEFEKKPFPIERIVFRGSDKPLGYPKSFEITNPYLIDKLYYSLIELINFQEIIKKKKSRKKRTSATIIKKVATELFNELTQVEKMSDWKSLCIIGYIFCLYKIGIKNEEPIMTEEKFNLLKHEKQIETETYLQYLAHRIKRYINN